jgi:hypothetical protein
MGNQLFGWAAGFALATRLNTDFDLLPDRIRRDDHHILDPRVYELGYFGLPAARKRLEKPWSLIEATTRLVGGHITRRQRQLVFREEGFAFDPRFAAITEPPILDGYFQSWKYFEGLESQMIDQLSQSAMMSAGAENLVKSLDSYPWVGVHVRRGDYKKVGNMALPGEHYYRRATELAGNMVGSAKFIVFSDDPVEARQLIPWADEYVGPERIQAAGDVLMCLAHATAIVGANSTLSWWAAFLAKERESPVFFPGTWFTNDQIPIEDLLPPEWYRVPID